MNQLIKTQSSLTPNEIEAISKVNPLAKPFVEAKNSIKFQLIEPADAIKGLFDLMNELINVSGENKKYHLDSDTTKNVAKLLFNELCTRYKGITLQEVRKAFTMGVMGEFGDYIGYGLATFSKFIKSYMESEKRSAAMKEWLKFQNDPPTTLKPITDLFKINMDLANGLFEIMTEELSKSIDTICNSDKGFYHLPSIFKFLNENFNITFSEETEKYIVTTAKMKYYNYIKKSGLPAHRQDDYKNIVTSVKGYTPDDLSKTIGCLEIGDNKTLDYYLQSEALKIVFLKLKAKNLTINNLTKLNK